MQHNLTIAGKSIIFERSYQENAFISRQLNFIHEIDASLYLPMEYGAMPRDSEKYVGFLFENYDDMKTQSIENIAAFAYKEGFWGKSISENPQMHLVWAKLHKKSLYKSSIRFELAFNDSEHDAYTLWVSSFKNTELKEVKRRAW